MLTSPKELLAGGDSGSLLDSLEQEGASLLMHRVHLPLTEEEHMPPKGKVQLTSEEIMLLEWWLENNHCFDCLVKDLPQEPKMTAVLESLEEDTSIHAQLAKEVDEVPQDFIMLLAQNNISAQLVSEEIPLLHVNFLQRKDVSADDFELLEDYKENIVGMNLGYTNLNDTLVEQLKPFKNLTNLQLQHTRISNEGIGLFKKFKYLESINLFGTSLDDTGLEKLASLPELKKLFVWQTQMTPTGLLAFQKEHGSVQIQGQIADSVFAASSLTPPTIIAEQEVFKDSLEISLELFFDGAKLHYVLEDSSSDTLPKLYTEPFYLKESATLRTFATLEGWEPSSERKEDFLKSNVEVSKISLSKPPHPKYTAQGPETLLDFKRGTTNFADGNWLGYQSEHMNATVQFDEGTSVSSVSIGCLSMPSNWIFYPTNITVWGSKDGNAYSKLETLRLPDQDPTTERERSIYTIDFDPVSLKKMRVLVESPLVNPAWHQVPGGKSFIFVDELVFN